MVHIIPPPQASKFTKYISQICRHLFQFIRPPYNYGVNSRLCIIHIIIGVTTIGTTTERGEVWSWVWPHLVVFASLFPTICDTFIIETFLEIKKCWSRNRWSHNWAHVKNITETAWFVFFRRPIIRRPGFWGHWKEKCIKFKMGFGMHLN